MSDENEPFSLNRFVNDSIDWQLKYELENQRAIAAEQKLKKFQDDNEPRWVPFTVHHPDKTTEEIKIPVIKNEHTGEDMMTIEGEYIVTSTKALYRMKLAEAAKEAAEQTVGRLSKMAGCKPENLEDEIKWLMSQADELEQIKAEKANQSLRG